MKTEVSYLTVSGYFDLWVRLMERRTRLMQVQDSKINHSKILLISPPTDRGIKILSQANPRGESHLLCFSEALADIAKEYSARHKMTNLHIWVKPFFSLPCDVGSFDIIFANCFFDFCPRKTLHIILRQIEHALKDNGLLCAVHMGTPTDSSGLIWSRLFERFHALSGGCHPVDIAPALAECGFKLKKDLTVKRLGLPLQYLVAKKEKTPCARH